MTCLVLLILWSQLFTSRALLHNSKHSILRSFFWAFLSSQMDQNDNQWISFDHNNININDGKYRNKGKDSNLVGVNSSWRILFVLKSFYAQIFVHFFLIFLKKWFLGEDAESLSRAFFFQRIDIFRPFVSKLTINIFFHSSPSFICEFIFHFSSSESFSQELFWVTVMFVSWSFQISSIIFLLVPFDFYLGSEFIIQENSKRVPNQMNGTNQLPCKFYQVRKMIIYDRIYFLFFLLFLKSSQFLFCFFL